MSGACGSSVDHASGVEHHAQIALLVLDVVESVRLMADDEASMIHRWLQLVDRMSGEICGEFSMRVLKRMGDGLILGGPSVRDAAAAAFRALAIMEADNGYRDAGRQIHLRCALAHCPLWVTGDDLYGDGLNVAMRILSLANPGEIVATASAREQLVASLDAEVEDLGDCYLKHVAKPVRVYRIGAPGSPSLLAPAIAPSELVPMLAVVPFEGGGDEAAPVLGDIMAEELITDFGRSGDIGVISRLSSSVLRARSMTVGEMSRCLSADYVLSGTFRVVSRRVVLHLELAEAEREAIVWSERCTGTVEDVLDPGSPLMAGVVEGVCAAIQAREVRRARSHSLQSLKHYTLMMAAIGLMHRLSADDFVQSRTMLEALIARASRQAVPHAWLAKWHVFNVQQGWSQDPDKDATLAAQATRVALEVDPECSLALAVDGFVHTNLLKRLDVAETLYDRALTSQPSNSLAWLLRGTLHVFRGEGPQAVSDIERALALSPLDPHRFFFDALAAGAYFANGQYERAIASARASMRLNRYHASTLRILTVSLLRLGNGDEARAMAGQLRSVEPNLTVSNWLTRSPSADYPIGRDFARSLRELGIPEN